MPVPLWYRRASGDPVISRTRRLFCILTCWWTRRLRSPSGSLYPGSAADILRQFGLQTVGNQWSCARVAASLPGVMALSNHLHLAEATIKNSPVVETERVVDTAAFATKKGEIFTSRTPQRWTLDGISRDFMHRTSYSPHWPTWWLRWLLVWYQCCCLHSSHWDS